MRIHDVDRDHQESWVVCQLGAREDYAVARALHRRGLLHRLITEAWVPPGHLLGRFAPRLGQRTHSELPDKNVIAPTAGAVALALRHKLMGPKGWAQIIDRNLWFQNAAVERLRAFDTAYVGTVFAYSYAALQVFAFARARGWKTVLGQIDPGPVEARLVSRLYDEAGDNTHEQIPQSYWEDWRRETELADVIVVNSSWSRECLIEEGVPADKIEIVPLAHEADAAAVRRDVPSAFNPERPLRLLFLGQVTRRKGIDILLDAMRALEGLSIKLEIVGPLQTTLPTWVAADPRISLRGAVPRSAVDAFYTSADVLVFPTRSDGFGLTQLEAFRFGLPVIASDRCGTVATDRVDGRILQDIDASALADVLRELLEQPAKLIAWQAAVRLDPRFGIAALGDRLADIAKATDIRTKRQS